jgi:osmotically-inducible protein OsmY
MTNEGQDEKRPGYVIGPTSGAPDVQYVGPTAAGGSARSDGEIADEVRARLSASSLASCRLAVTVENRIVTLSGTVPDEPAKHLAEHIGESVGGVREARSDLRVGRSGTSAEA